MDRITSPNYYTGRRRRPRVVVLHAAQTPCVHGAAANVMRYLARPAVMASAHYCTDPGTTVAGVAEQDTAWATPDVNADGLQIEQAGYAEFGSGLHIPGRDGEDDGYQAARDAYGEGALWPSWRDPLMRSMIERETVPLVAELCVRWNIPPVLLEPPDLLAGLSGVTDHRRCSIAYRGDHWDCGHHYPLGEVVTAARDVAHGLTPTWDHEAAAGEQTPAAAIHTEEGGDMFNCVRTEDNDTLWLVRPAGKAPLAAVCQREANTADVGEVLRSLLAARQLVPHEDNPHSRSWGFVSWEALAVLEWHPAYLDLRPA